MIERNRCAISGEVSAADALAAVQTATQAEVQLVELLTLACARDATLAHVAQAHAGIVAALEQLDDGFASVKERARHWIVGFWRKATERQAALLAAPTVMRSAVAEVSEDPPAAAGVARILLAAEVGVRTTYRSDMRQKLRSVADQAGQTSS